MKRAYLILIFKLLFCCSYAQGVSVPSASMPTKEHQIMIDSLLKITKWEAYFVNYCETRIDARAKEKKWSYQQIADAKKQINYTNFKEITLYNFYSFFTSEQLKTLINLMQPYNADAGSNFIFITTPFIQQNLEVQLTSYFDAAK